jgi:hypothetical protein
MGVMLFLVLEPSQRPDQNSAFSRASAGAGAVGAAAAGSQTSPIIVAIWNKGDNPLRSLGTPPDFQRVPKEPKNQTPDKIVLTALAADMLPPLRFRSDEFGDSTSATIFVGAQDKLIERTVTCNGGADVQINVGQVEPVTFRCSEVINVCTIDVPANGPFDVVDKDVRLDQFLLLIVPHDLHPTIDIADSKKCLISPTFDAALSKNYNDDQVNSGLYQLARDCDLKEEDRVHLFRADDEISECVRAKLLASGKFKWRGQCSDLQFGAKHARGYFLAATRLPPGNNACQRVLVKGG